MKQPGNSTLSSAQHPRAIQQIVEAASKLTVPTLGPLYQTFREVCSGVQDHRTSLQQEQTTLREEGFEAAARLTLSIADKTSPRRCSYFEQTAPKEQP